MKVLITGATGLIGREIVRQCKEEQISVHFLTTRKDKLEAMPNCTGFYWDPRADEIDIAAFAGVAAIIHLAGATVSKRWTKEHKRAILESRTQTANLLFTTLEQIDHDVRHFISGSGVSIYPASKTKLYAEEDQAVDTGFLAEVVVAWEAAADQFSTLGMDVTKMRTGVVLASNEGALAEMIKPIKMRVGAVLGDGDQWLSWIHLADIGGMYIYVLTKQLEGVYNAVAPNPVTNSKITKLIARKLGTAIRLPKVPAFVLKMILGEMASLVLEGQLVSARKIEQQGFLFRYYNIESALEDLI